MRSSARAAAWARDRGGRTARSAANPSPRRDAARCRAFASAWLARPRATRRRPAMPATTGAAARTASCAEAAVTAFRRCATLPHPDGPEVPVAGDATWIERLAAGLARLRGRPLDPAGRPLPPARLRRHGDYV